MGKGPEQILLQGGHTEGPETYEKMLSITSHQTSQNGHNKQINKVQRLERLWRKWNPGTLLVGMQTGAATVENNMEFPQIMKNITSHCWDYTLRVRKHQFKRTYVPQCS